MEDGWWCDAVVSGDVDDDMQTWTRGILWLIYVAVTWWMTIQVIDMASVTHGGHWMDDVAVTGHWRSRLQSLDARATCGLPMKARASPWSYDDEILQSKVLWRFDHDGDISFLEKWTEIGLSKIAKITSVENFEVAISGEFQAFPCFWNLALIPNMTQGKRKK